MPDALQLEEQLSRELADQGLEDRDQHSGVHAWLAAGTPALACPSAAGCIGNNADGGGAAPSARADAELPPPLPQLSTAAVANQAAPSGVDALQARARERHWVYALAVHGSEAAAAEAGCEPLPLDASGKLAALDYALYCSYMAAAKRCLEAPDVDDPNSDAHRRICAMATSFRGFITIFVHLRSEERCSATARLLLVSGGRSCVACVECAKAGEICRAASLCQTPQGGSATEAVPAATALQYESSASFVMTHKYLDVEELAEMGSEAPEVARLTGDSAGTCWKPVPRRSPSISGGGRSGGTRASGGTSASGGGGGSGTSCNSSAAGSSPGSVKLLHAAYRDGKAVDVQPVLAAIQLTPVQIAAVLQARRELLEALERATQERQELLARLQPGSGGGRGAGLKADAATPAELLDSMEAEGRLITAFSSWFTCRLLTPFQHAKCSAVSFPVAPDAIALGDMLAADAAKDSWQQGQV